MLCGGGGGSGAQPTGHSHGGGGAGRFVLYDGTYTGTGKISVGHGGQNCEGWTFADTTEVPPLSQHRVE